MSEPIRIRFASDEPAQELEDHVHTQLRLDGEHGMGSADARPAV